MGKLKLQMQITMDTFVAGPNAESDFFTWNWDNAMKEYVTKITDSVDCIILGRKLAQGFIPHWASNPTEEGAEKINSTKKVVFTRTLEKSQWGNTVLAKGELVDEVNKLKKKPGGDLIAYGGSNFVSSLIEHDLVDEYFLFVNPAAIGKGMPIFQSRSKTLPLKLVNATPFSCGIVGLHYQKP